VSLFDEFSAEAGRRRDRRFAVSINSSPLIRRLASEAGFALTDPHTFAARFQAQVSAMRAGREQASKTHERLREQHAELLVVAGEQEALLAEATPFTTLEVIERAQIRLSAVLFQLTLVESALAAAELPDATAETVGSLRSKTASDLNAWRTRLGQELERIRAEIDELERSGVAVRFDFDATPVRLLDELMAVTQAISDADACLKVVEERGLEHMLSPEARLAPEPLYKRLGKQLDDERQSEADELSSAST
jgi:hypothetical protein